MQKGHKMFKPVFILRPNFKVAKSNDCCSHQILKKCEIFSIEADGALVDNDKIKISNTVDKEL